jgi:hypothetical protein
MSNKLPIIQGEQYWRILRTDRDGASRDEVLKMVGPFMAFALSEAMTAGPQEKVIKTGPADGYEWRIDKARPIQALDASQELLSLPEGTTLGDRKTADPVIIPTVRATKAWYITVRFWWRGTSTEITYPAQTVSSLGVATHGILGSQSDWLLDHATAPAEPGQDPGDATWGTVIEEQTKETVKQVASAISFGAMGLVGVAAGLGLLYLLISRTQQGGK